MTPLSDIVSALDAELKTGSFVRDVSRNGLQVAGAAAGVSKVCCGVDASTAFIEEALRRGAQLLVVHHGISWGDSLSRLTGANYALVAPLVKSGAALYAAHLPLDAHPALGNNANLAKALGLSDLEPFGEYAGYDIGFKGRFADPVPWDAFLRRLREVCPDGRFESFDPLGDGSKPVRTVGVVSGGAAEDFPQAVEAGLDAYVTGEMGLADYNALLANPIRFAAAGHYATERFGPRALAAWIGGRFGVEAEFVDTHLRY